MKINNVFSKKDKKIKSKLIENQYSIIQKTYEKNIEGEELDLVKNNEQFVEIDDEAEVPTSDLNSSSPENTGLSNGPKPPGTGNNRNRNRIKYFRINEPDTLTFYDEYYVETVLRILCS